MSRGFFRLLNHEKTAPKPLLISPGEFAGGCTRKAKRLPGIFVLRSNTRLYTRPNHILPCESAVRIFG